MDAKTYQLPEPSVNVLAALNSEAVEARGKSQLADQRANAVLVGIAAALGIPDGVQIQLDLPNKMIVAMPPAGEAPK